MNNKMDDNKGLKILFGVFAGATAIYVIYALTNKSNTKIANVGASAASAGYSSPLLKNHFGQRIEFKTPSGNVIKGYNYPANMSDLTFPVAIVTKAEVKGWGDSSMINVGKTGNPQKPVYYTTPQGVEVPLTYNELIEKTLIA